MVVDQLERAGLVTKQRRGREQLVHTDIATIRTAHHLLDHFEALWRGRIDRFADVLTRTDSPARPAGTDQGAPA